MPFPSDEEVERLLALPPPPPLPLISLSPPEEYKNALLACTPAYRAVMGRLRASSPSTHHPLHPSPPLPPLPSSLHLPPHVHTSLPLPSSPLPPLPASLFIPPPVDRREDIPEAELPPRKRLCLTALTSRYEVGESLTTTPRPTGGNRIDYGFIGTLDSETRRQRAEEVSYGIRDVWVDPTEAVKEVALTTLEGVNARVTELAAIQEQDTQDIYDVIKDTQDRQTQLFQRVDGLVEDRQFHYETARLLDQEALNNMPPRRSSATARVAAAAATPMTAAAVEQLIKARVSAALANHETLRNITNGQGDGSHNSDTGTRGTVRTPLFHISNCAVENQVKFATCTFLGNALTWWNSHIKTITQDVTYAMDWKALKKMMTLSLEANVGVYNLWKASRGTVTTKNKKSEHWRLYTTGPGEKREYTGSLPLYTKCNCHHKGPCAPRCNKCKKISHLARDCRCSDPNINNNNRGSFETTQNVGTCYECSVQGNFKRDCLKLKNKNYGNQGGNSNAQESVRGVLYLTTLAPLMILSPTTLDHYYDVELADGKIIGINTIIRGCTLNFLDHPFNINLMPVELGSFDIIVGMDWLAKYHAVIDYAEKVVRHHVLLAHVATKEIEDKSGEKRLEDVPIVRDFPEVFPEDFSGLPPTRQVEFRRFCSWC
ncbi:reverse transcriptase domain-containing protein [Tanacetum coccineum]